MSVEQNTAPITLPSVRAVKSRIAAHKDDTEAFVSNAQSLIAKHDSLLSRLRQVTSDREAALLKERSLIWTIRAFLRMADTTNGLSANTLREAGLATSLALETNLDALADYDYWAIEQRSNAHYDDLKALTLLEVAGDRDADALHGETINSIRSLRQVQRAVERVTESRQEAGALAVALIDL